MKGQQVKYAKQLTSKLVSVYLGLQNDTIKVRVSNKRYDNFEYLFIMNLKSTA
jgi:hypothetical protein